MVFSKNEGCGVGLRAQHFPVITGEWPEMDWFEAISENFMDSGGRPLRILEKIRSRYPIALHGTSLSIGSADPLRLPYLKRLKALADCIEPFIVSDHLCWSSVEGEELHDLLPLPFTEEAIEHVVKRVEKVQDFLGRKILLENVSTYVTYRHSAMPEWEFLAQVAGRSGCGILLDLNNIYVNAFNHQFDAKEYLKNIPADKVGQFHLAGHTDMGKFLFDTHTGQVIDPVWELYREALGLYGKVSTLIEWDEAIPEFSVLAGEAQKAKRISATPEASKLVCRQLPQPFEAGFPAMPFGGNANGEGVDGRRRRSAGPTVPRTGLLADGCVIGTDLSQLQRRMKTWIQPEKEKLECPLNLQAGDPGSERMEVYAEGYAARIHESLSEAFEAVKKVIGPAAFLDFAKAYAARYPSRHYNLNFSGKNFPEFLKTLAPAKEWPFLPDLAELEWKILAAFHAFDQKPFAFLELAGLSLEDWEKAKLAFQPSVELLHSEWPVLDIWNVRKKPVEEVKIDLVNRPQWILVFRQDVEVRTRLMQPQEYAFLSEIKKGMPLGEACEKTALPEEQSPLIQEWFQFWASAGLVAKI